MVWWWVAGAVVAAVGALIANDSSSSSSSSSTSGPSRSALKQAESRKIKNEVKQQCIQFLRGHEQLGLVYGQSGKKLYVDACAALFNDTLVAESFFEITEMALIDGVNWEDVLTIQMGHIRNVQNEHSQCARSVTTCLDMLCGLHAWEPEPNADATLQSLMEFGIEMNAELQNAAATNGKSPALTPRFVVQIPREMPALCTRFHQKKVLLHALEHLELYEDTDEITAYAASQPDFAALLAQWRVLNKAQHDSHPRVVVCGLLKVGKSTLLNMLTEHYEKECFPSARTRKTTTLQTELHDQICYVDTPGLDAPEGDEKVAWSAFTSAEKVLFVVSAEQDMERTELEILQHLAAERSDFAEVCTVVVTYMDALGLEEADSIRKLQSVRKKIMKTTGADLPIFPVSSTTYRKGVLEVKPALRRRGGIDLVREHVQRVHTGNLIESRAERLNTLKKSMYESMYEELAVIESEVREIESEVERQNKAMAEAMDVFLSGLRSKLYNYKNM